MKQKKSIYLRAAEHMAKDIELDRNPQGCCSHISRFISTNTTFFNGS